MFRETVPPTTAEPEALLHKIINRVMRLLNKASYLIKEDGVVYVVNTDPANRLAPLQAASATWRIAQGPSRLAKGTEGAEHRRTWRRVW